MNNTKIGNMPSQVAQAWRASTRRVHPQNRLVCLVCLGGNVVFWLLGATALQFAVFDIPWLAIFWIRYPTSAPTPWVNGGQRERRRNRQGVLIFLLQVVIACDVATVIVDSLTSTAIV
ncbi:hypothetical protein [Ciceribacter ferrooxidans]|uniref:Uncharacterized protein n=1 Tax=Ciceribacter ferrooxidans TaxID=2509717 RepID=A0A4Q2T4B5_9HYPH|nr:hypothetical protein [Ciceribacter ferrooxidans]RYC11688.1 hypothetical protein EUU22_11440 [Ciceribacter ferrooxidans]